MSNVIQLLSLFLLIIPSQFSDAQIVPLIDYLQSWFYDHEQPPHTVVRTLAAAPGIEERIYASQKWACTQEFSTTQKIDQKRSQMFFKLFAYSDGRNNISKKVQMTIPISTVVDHRNGDLNSYMMCAYLPKDMQDDPPTPMDPSVKIITRPEMRVYVKRFGGYAPESTFSSQMKDLSVTLKKEGLPYIEEELGSRAVHYNNIYDAPAKFWNRRNEVWLLAPLNV